MPRRAEPKRWATEEVQVKVAEDAAAATTEEAKAEAVKAWACSAAAAAPAGSQPECLGESLVAAAPEVATAGAAMAAAAMAEVAKVVAATAEAETEAAETATAAAARAAASTQPQTAGLPMPCSPSARQGLARPHLRLSRRPRSVGGRRSAGRGETAGRTTRPVGRNHQAERRAARA